MNYAEATESEFGGSCPALLEAAHPEVYWRNAFRVAALSVEATPRDISRQAERLRMMQTYNAKAASKTPLALNPPPDEHAVREALHKLHDPEKRLIDEFFWFWPHQLGQSRADEALALLAEDNIDQAAKGWLQMEESSEAYVSMHNLAVLFHCLALDWEQQAFSRRLDKKEIETVQRYWEDALKRWKVLLEHEPFWSRLTARIRALEDPRLTTGLARRMRVSLPLALLSINATLAVRYAEVGNFEMAERQLGIMGLWEGSLAQKALGDACEPLRQRIKSICKNAESQANKDPTHGDKATREVIVHTKSLLVILDTLLSPGDSMRDAAHDEVAVCALYCQILFGNKTKNWKISLELLELALPIAVGQAARDRIQENITTVKGNLECGTCWFCQQNPAEDEAVCDVKMYGNVTRTPTQNGVEIQWRHLTVKVPRCARCNSAHNRQATCVVVGAVIGGMLGLAGCIADGLKHGADVMLPDVFLGVVPAGIGAGIGAAIGVARRPKGVKPESAKGEFSSVKELLSQGWQFGERPATQ